MAKREANGGKRIQFTKLVARRGDEFYFVESFFDHGEMDGKPFRGATGFSLMPVSVAQHEYDMTQEGGEEYFEDAWATMCGDSEDYEFGYGPTLEDMRGYVTKQRELQRAQRALERLQPSDSAERRLIRAQDAMEVLKERRKELAFKDFVAQVLRNDGDDARYDLSYSCNGGWEQIRAQHPDTMGEEKVELFECVGCGRQWDEDRQEWDEVYNPALLDWIYWWERGGFHQYKAKPKAKRKRRK